MPRGRGPLSNKTGMIQLTIPDSGNTYYLRASEILSVAVPNPKWKDAPKGIQSVVVLRAVGGDAMEWFAKQTPEEVIRLMEEAHRE